MKEVKVGQVWKYNYSEYKRIINQGYLDQGWFNCGDIRSKWHIKGDEEKVNNFFDQWTLIKDVEEDKREELKGVENLADKFSCETQGEHYKLEIDPYEYCFKNEFNPLQFNAIKYISRYKLKNGKQDLEKAINTIKRLIELEYDNK